MRVVTQRFFISITHQEGLIEVEDIRRALENYVTNAYEWEIGVASRDCI